MNIVGLLVYLQLLCKQVVSNFLALAFHLWTATVLWRFNIQVMKFKIYYSISTQNTFQENELPL